MGTDQADNAPATASLHREDLDLPVVLENTRDDDFPCRTPPALAFSTTAKGSFVAFDHSFEWRPQVLGVGAAGSRRAVKPLRGLGAGRGAKPLPVDRYPQNKPLQKLTFGALCQAARLPDTTDGVARPAPLAFMAAITKLPAPCVAAFRASFHRQTSLQLARFG